MRHCLLILALALSFSLGERLAAQELERQLKSEGAAALAVAAVREGDARRGAILFHQPHMACAKCHVAGGGDETLGPDLARLGDQTSETDLGEAVLFPSKKIRQGFETHVVQTSDGKIVNGLLVEQSDERIVLRDAANSGRRITLRAAEIEDRSVSTASIMPEGQVNQLAGREQFLDLLRYLIEIHRGGPARARELQPPASAIVLQVPEYEQHIDHAGLITELDDAAFSRGEQIYNRLCINCHGDHDRPGTLPTAPRFGSHRFKNGHDPFSMYRTLTYGYGMMVPQTWMVPRQKYDVIHYLREEYLKEHNPPAYASVDEEYLKTLPAGNTHGPEPQTLEPWVTMDYGPSLINTYEIGGDGTNFAYKGIAVRLDSGPGGVSRGRAWMIFEHDTLRVAAAWTGEGFIDWNGIHFNGRHQVHPRIVGDVQFANPTGPGWAHPQTGEFRDDQRVRGRDGKMYGPLPPTWGRYEGLYHHGGQAVISYTVGGVRVLESPGLADAGQMKVFTRTFNIEPRPRDLVLQVAQHPDSLATVHVAKQGEAEVVVLKPASERDAAERFERFAFSGGAWGEVENADGFDMTGRDYTITARIRTQRGGTIFAKTATGDQWVPNGKALFVRNGHLCFDIGWVGVVESRRRINDGKWHIVAMTWENATGAARLYIDGEPDGEKALRPRESVRNHVVRIGFAAPDFPEPHSNFTGDIEEVRFCQRLLSAREIAQSESNGAAQDLIARWRFADADSRSIADLSGNGRDAVIRSNLEASTSYSPLAFRLSPAIEGAEWTATAQGDLRLRIPAGEQPLRFTLSIARLEEEASLDSFVELASKRDSARDLTPLTHGGPPRWRENLTTEVMPGDESGPFAVDVLTPPDENPWLAQMRFSGLDFFPGGASAAVCTWDGDVWLVGGLMESAPRPKLTWRRIASGLFQPLGLKIIAGRIYIACRDQIAVLHDLNGDGEADFIENFNSDHQVTEHFHEFATGLQTDGEGNLYYAKAARHALPAVVPQHGTLLRVSPDGRRTEIVATGFRAPNGVCVNGDGTFVATDQEGHWTPKNRINWIEEGGFYGNMWGYHDVTDPSDNAMAPPLCWITNAVDRSPSEPLWVESSKWGPLAGSLLNLSYGYGKVYVTLSENVGGRVQGGVCELPIGPVPTGLMRGRFNPRDGQLYACGLFAWGSNQQQPGGFYRVRYTGKPLHTPISLRARAEGVEIGFTNPLERESAADAKNFSVRVWSLKRSANYGSEHHDERELKIAAARLSEDGRAVMLLISEMQTTQCMAIRYDLHAADGSRVQGEINNTVTVLPE